MAVRYQRKVAEVEIASSGTTSIPVGRPSITPGSILVAFMSKQVDHGPPSVTDSKGNTWVFRAEDNELVDDGTIGVVTCLVTTELLPDDIITFDHQAAFGEKTHQLHEYRAAGVMSVIGAGNTHSTFPHGQPRGAGSVACAVGDASIAAFLQNTTTEMVWTPGTGYTGLLTLRGGSSGEVYSEWRIMAATTAAPTATSALDTAGAGVSVVIRGAAPTGIPVAQGLPTIVADAVESGQPLFCSTGWWAPGGDTYTYQWKRTGVNIAGATSEIYIAQQLDVGKNVTCAVTATNTFGSTTSTSSPELIAQGPLPPAPPALFLAYAGEWEERSIRYPVDGGWT